MFAHLNRDAKLLLLSRALRSFAFSYMNVVFSIYLARIGYSTIMIGFVHSVAYISGALLTAVWGFLSDRHGRKKILIVLAVLTICSSTIYIFFTQVVFILLAVILVNVGAGGSAGGGQGGGTFNPVEQALLAEKCSAEERNRAFSNMAFVGSIFGSLGALVSGLPEFLQERWAWQTVDSYKPLFGLNILFCIALIFLYQAIREEHRPSVKPKGILSKQSGAFVTKLSLLAFVDHMGSGMLSPLIAYWFFLRFGVELKALGVMFFLSYFSAAISFLVAPIIARHIGVVRTMFFSHATASFLYLVLPFTPTFFIASILVVARSFVAYMDNPLRESFTMAMVQSGERGAAAGVTNLARVVPYGVSPTLSAYMMQSLSLTVPLVIGGSLQLTHDITFYYLFRHVKPPEEKEVEGRKR